MKNILAITALVCAAQVTQILAWNSETHLMIAFKAYENLKKSNPVALAKAEDLLKKFSDYSTKKHEQNYPFIECHLARRHQENWWRLVIGLAF